MRDRVPVLNVPLGPWLTEEMWRKAENRNRGHRGDLAVDRRRGGVELHWSGVLGEYAVASVLGRDYSEVRDDQPRGDRGVDFVVNGKTVQVKGTPTHTSEYLLVADRHLEGGSFHADVAVACRPMARLSVPPPEGDCHWMQIYGWTTREAFRAGCEPFPLGTSGFSVHATALWGPDHLWWWLWDQESPMPRGGMPS